MNTSNPFQVPSCFQNNFERRRRERFRKSVLAVIAAAATLIVGLLIEGCVSEGQGTSEITPLTPEASVPQPEKTIASPAAIPQANPAPVAVVSKQVAPKTVQTATTSSSQSESVYVVKSGDTLTHIARTHGTTVKALKSANDLTSDHILVGAKLKIPAA